MYVHAVLGLDNLPDYDEVVRRQFQAFISTHEYNADQINFLRALQSVFIQKRKIERVDLYAPPLSRFGAPMISPWSARQSASPSLCHPVKADPLNVTSGIKFWLAANIADPITQIAARLPA